MRNVLKEIWKYVLNKKLLGVCAGDDAIAINTTKWLIEKGADVNAADKYGNTALMKACVKGRTDIAEFLIEKGADIDTKGEFGYTALMKACVKGHTDVTRFLIERDADINAKDDNGWTALMWACANGHTDVARLLIEKGADINAKDRSGRTAMDYSMLDSKNKAVQKVLSDTFKRSEAPHLTQTLSGLEEKDNRESESAYALSGEYARGNDISVSVANRALRNGR